MIYALCAACVITEHITQAILASFSTALLMVGSRSSSASNYLLTRPVILYVGMISYSLYLFHFAAPTLGFNGSLEAFGFSAAIYSMMNFMFSMAIAIMLATGVFRLVEVPGRRVIRTAADRLLGVTGSTSVASRHGALAER